MGTGVYISNTPVPHMVFPRINLCSEEKFNQIKTR